MVSSRLSWLTSVDIVAREAWVRLKRSGLEDADVINATRALPVHTDTIADLDLLRDIPAFPSWQAIPPGQDPRSSKKRARGWDEVQPVAADTFTDNADNCYLDALDKLCPELDCRTFGCQLHCE
jgi:hypothetical protein